MTIGPGVTGLLGPNGAGKSTLIALMSGFLAPSTGTVTLDGEPLWRNEQVYRKIGLVPEREALFDYLTGRAVRRRQRRAARPAGPGRGRPGLDRAGRDERRAGPRDLDVLQGHAAADQDGVVPRPRPVRAAAGRAVQRHGPAPADAPDGPAAHDGRRGPHRPVQLAHPGGGRAGGPPDRGRRRRTARGLRRLRCDPPPDDRPAQPVRAAHRGRPHDGLGPPGRPVGPRRAARGPRAASRSRPPTSAGSARCCPGWPASTASGCSRSPRPTSRSRASSPTWCRHDDDRHPPHDRPARPAQRLRPPPRRPALHPAAGARSGWPCWCGCSSGRRPGRRSDTLVPASAWP